MSRRNTYLLGGLAVVVGAVMIAFAVAALTSDDGDSSPARRADAPQRPVAPVPPSTPQPPAGNARKPSGVKARGGDIGKQLSRRRPVQAPDFSAAVIRAGAIPEALEAPFERATAEGRLDMANLRGTPVVLHLWSSQCAPCRADARLVEATWKRWGQRGVLFVSMHVEESRASTPKVVIRQYDLTYPAVSDRSGAIAGRYGATALPQTFFISSAGDIVGEVIGSPSVRQLEVGTAATQSGRPFGSEQGSARVPLR
jgi:peroxiredoxin